MKKMLAILMALLMAALLLPAYAEEGDVAEIAEIAGTVLEIGEESILLETPEGQLIEAILTADTIREGKEIAEGDFIHVMYNGQMTRSYPAQVTAQHIGCYVLTGTVSDITDEGFTLTTDETTYIVHATAEQLAQITDGAEINVYFSGVIAMSLPGQISAEQITAVEEEAILTGTVVEAYITMETADGQQIQVNLTSLTQLPDGIPDLGDAIRVTYNGQMTSSIPAQVTADTVDIAVTIDELAGEIVEITGDGILLQTKDMQVLVNVDEGTVYETDGELAVGDYIHVLYDGIMTRSLPAQVYAQKIGCYKTTGTVSELTESGFLLTTETDVVQVNADAALLDGLENGMTVTVYSNGAMTMSLPGQISAEQITAVEEEAILTGTVVEAYITMETADGQQIQVNLTSLTQLPDGIPDLGDAIRVTYNGQMTSSIPAQVTADTVDIAVTIDELAGEIVEITGDGILLQTKDMQVLVNVDEGTVYETDGELAVGDYIHVLYDGIMTRSLPAQVYAQKIGCYKTTGTVSELTESGFLLTTETDVVQVNADAALLDGLENGMTVTVYSNGAMTMSLPGQISAEKIVKAE